jgi:hypothetical protein
MGYLLSCHLVIEHWMDEWLKARYPELDWESARLTFEKRCAVLNKCDWEALPGDENPLLVIKHLNSLRNRFGHRVNYKLTSEDMLPFVQFLQRGSRSDRPAYHDQKEALYLFTSLCVGAFASEVLCADEGKKFVIDRPRQ